MKKKCQSMLFSTGVVNLFFWFKWRKDWNVNMLLQIYTAFTYCKISLYNIIYKIEVYTYHMQPYWYVTRNVNAWHSTNNCGRNCAICYWTGVTLYTMLNAPVNYWYRWNCDLSQRCATLLPVIFLFTSLIYTQTATCLSAGKCGKAKSTERQPPSGLLWSITATENSRLICHYRWNWCTFFIHMHNMHMLRERANNARIIHDILWYIVT